MKPFALSDDHIAAVNRQRRVIVNFDAVADDKSILEVDVEDLVRCYLCFADQEGCQIDSIFWDMATL